MKLSDYDKRMSDNNKYLSPLLGAGDSIKLKESDEGDCLFSKPMKKGNYKVLNVRKSVSHHKGMVYELLKSGAKQDRCISTVCIDKAIEAGLIKINGK